jgi:hypothetical protein
MTCGVRRCGAVRCASCFAVCRVVSCCVVLCVNQPAQPTRPNQPDPTRPTNPAHLRPVCKVPELGLPQREAVGGLHREAQLEAEDAEFGEAAVADGELAGLLAGKDVGEGRVLLAWGWFGVQSAKFTVWGRFSALRSN